MEIWTQSPEETEQVGAALAARLQPGQVVAFRGPLGVGKTAFTRGLARGLGVAGPVTSPTYTIVNEYRSGRLPLFHFDLYRIADYDELYAIGFFDYLDRGGILAVEWSENIPELADELENVININIQKLSENERRITVTGKGIE